MKSLPGFIALTLLLISVISGLLAGCGQASSGSDTVGVAVTILPQAEFVEKVGGEKVEVTVMVPPGASPHSYEPTPSQMAALSEAVMYAKVGSGVEFELTWMEDLLAQNPDIPVVDCSRGITLEHAAVEEQHSDEEEAHGEGGLDPHIWMSPVNAQTMVRNITDGLIQVDPDNAAVYEQNRDAYLAELEELDRNTRESLAPFQGRKFMVYHPAVGYYAREYGLDMLPVEVEGKEPTAGGLLDLIDQAREHNIDVIFVEPQFNPQSAEVIAQEIGGSVVTIDPLAKDYIKNISDITDAILRALE